VLATAAVAEAVNGDVDLEEEMDGPWGEELLAVLFSICATDG